MSKKLTEVPADDTERAGGRCAVFSTDPERLRRARMVLPPAEVADDIALAFKAFSHPTRVRILMALSAGELCVCEISEVVGVSISAVSHQLALLRRQRLVRSRAEGKVVHYSLGDHPTLRFLATWARGLSEGDVQ